LHSVAVTIRRSGAATSHSVPGPREVPDEHGRGQAAVDLELAEPAGLGPRDHLARQVGRGDGDADDAFGQGVLEQHRDRVRLLPAGAGADQICSRSFGPRRPTVRA
jgi:hypothetical protein